MEKGTRAFVAYVRGYREHQVRIPACQSLDQLKTQNEPAMLERRSLSNRCRKCFSTLWNCDLCRCACGHKSLKG